MDEVMLRPAREGESEALWRAFYSDLSWKRFNAPYFKSEVPTLEAFQNGKLYSRLLEGRDELLIQYGDEVVGSVSFYWECEETRWLEAGIVIHRSEYWSRGIGRSALRLWIDRLFAMHELERVGMTTWSGNPRMIRCAQSLGFQVEGRLRRCRYYEGVYYDSIRLGVLREEWQEIAKKMPD